MTTGTRSRGERGELQRNGDENGQIIEVSRTTWPSVCLERMTGIEPALSAWEAEVLPLNYIRVGRSEFRPAAVVILAQVRGGRASPGRFRGGPRAGARAPVRHRGGDLKGSPLGPSVDARSLSHRRRVRVVRQTIGS